MSEREDFLWQRFFAAFSFLFVVFTFVGLEVFWPQPPSFALSAEQTAAYYVEHQNGFFIGIVMCSIGMAFLLAWTVQFCLMLWRLEGRSHAVTAVTVASLAASPILLSFDLAIFGVAAFRPGSTSPDVTRAMSDVAWLGSQHIWPMLALGMALAGVLIIKTRGRSGSLPAWLGYSASPSRYANSDNFPSSSSRRVHSRGTVPVPGTSPHSRGVRGFWPPAGRCIGCSDGSKRSI